MLQKIKPVLRTIIIFCHYFNDYKGITSTLLSADVWLCLPVFLSSTPQRDIKFISVWRMLLLPVLCANSHAESWKEKGTEYGAVSSIVKHLILITVFCLVNWSDMFLVLQVVVFMNCCSSPPFLQSELKPQDLKRLKV